MLSEQDQELVRAAKDLMNKRYKKDVHHVAAALRTSNGSIYTGIHLEAYVGTMAICAEAVALGVAATNGETDIDTIVAVYKDGQVVAPCGRCRELIMDYAPLAKVILPSGSGEQLVQIDSLLPHKYTRE